MDTNESRRRLVWIGDVPRWMEVPADEVAEHGADVVQGMQNMIFDLETRNRELHEDAQRTQRELGALRDESEGLRARVGLLVSDHERMAGEIVAAEQANSELVRLCVAHARLIGTRTQGEVIDMVVEIVSAMIGCEDFAFWLADPGLAPRRIAGMGAAMEGHGLAPLGDPVVARAMRERAVLVPAASTEGRAASAVVPLRDRDRVDGVLVLYDMLSHKPALEPIDSALLELLCDHAARAWRVAEPTSSLAVA